MSLREDLVDVGLRCQHGPARWRAERQAGEILALLDRHGLQTRQPLLPRCGTVSIKQFAGWPPDMRQAVTDRLARARIGWWQWSAIVFGDEWQVLCYRQAPDGGPEWQISGGDVGPGILWRSA